MGQKLWEYRKGQEFQQCPAVCSFNGKIFQLMVLSPDGSLGLHIIEETTSAEVLDVYQTEFHFTDPSFIEFESPFSITPTAFEGTGVNGNKQQTVSQKLNSRLSLIFRSENNNTGMQHAVGTLYRMAKDLGETSIPYIYCYVNYPISSVLIFKNEDLILANNYPTENESEVLYYCMAGIKKSALDIRKIKIFISGDKSESVSRLFERFSVYPSVIKPKLPYNDGELPPHATEAAVLYEYLKCALPVAN